MPQDEREGMARGNTIVCEAYVRVTDTASRDLDHDFIRSGFWNGEFGELQRSLGSYQPESMDMGDCSHLQLSGARAQRARFVEDTAV